MKYKAVQKSWYKKVGIYFYIYFVAELYSSELPTHVSCSLMPETHLFHHELYQFICVT